MIITRAVDISIQAVSPLSIVESGLRIGAPGWMPSLASGYESRPSTGGPVAGPTRIRFGGGSVVRRARGCGSGSAVQKGGLLEQVDHAGDHEADDGERDERLGPHRDLGPGHHRHR